MGAKHIYLLGQGCFPPKLVPLSPFGDPLSGCVPRLVLRCHIHGVCRMHITYLYTVRYSTVLCPLPQEVAQSFTGLWAGTEAHYNYGNPFLSNRDSRSFAQASDPLDVGVPAICVHCKGFQSNLYAAVCTCCAIRWFPAPGLSK
jgi:hypothetical protein